MPEGNKVLSHNIHQSRLKLKISQQQAAEMLGISLLHYGRLERGEQRASLEQIESIATAFQVSPYTLLDGCFKDSAPYFPPADFTGIPSRLNNLLAHCTPEEQLLCYDICERIVRGK
jgi:transcriptional regulator with XRE-family HTH domain